MEHGCVPDHDSFVRAVSRDPCLLVELGEDAVHRRHHSGLQLESVSLTRMDQVQAPIVAVVGEADHRFDPAIAGDDHEIGALDLPAAHRPRIGGDI